MNKKRIINFFKRKEDVDDPYYIPLVIILGKMFTIHTHNLKEHSQQ